MFNSARIRGVAWVEPASVTRVSCLLRFDDDGRRNHLVWHQPQLRGCRLVLPNRPAGRACVHRGLPERVTRTRMTTVGSGCLCLAAPYQPPRGHCRAATHTQTAEVDHGVRGEALTGRAGVWRPFSPPPTPGTRFRVAGFGLIPDSFLVDSRSRTPIATGLARAGFFDGVGRCVEPFAIAVVLALQHRHRRLLRLCAAGRLGIESSPSGRWSCTSAIRQSSGEMQCVAVSDSKRRASDEAGRVPYMQCSQGRRSDPLALPRRCIARWRPGLGGGSFLTPFTQRRDGVRLWL